MRCDKNGPEELVAGLQLLPLPLRDAGPPPGLPRGAERGRPVRQLAREGPSLAGRAGNPGRP
eukprot:9820563-Lingulodinium_polyedra.AAC.1